LNPVIIDASRARNAGCLLESDGLFRCSQGQGFDFYGKRVLINRITKLNESEYSEECLCVVTPSFRPGILGTHHFHSKDKITVFDFSTNAKIAALDSLTYKHGPM
jgi:hypothetical protein